MSTIGLYAGTFDPITNGHLDIIKRSLSFCDRLIVAIGVNPTKKNMFSETERTKQIGLALDSLSVKDKELSVITFQGLLVEYAKQEGANVLIRGIRSVSDFEYELNLANVNRTLLPTLETVFLPTSPELAVVSSSMVKEIARHGGDISKFVPIHVANALKSKLARD